MVDMGAIEFGVYLRKARRELDVKQADLAIRLGKSQAAISDIERGDRADISREEIEEVLRALVEGRVDAEKHLQRVIAEGMKEAGFLYSGYDLPEIDHIPDDEYLQDKLKGYSGTDPGLLAAKATLESVDRALKNLGPELTGEEPPEVLARGRGPRKGITKID